MFQNNTENSNLSSPTGGQGAIFSYVLHLADNALILGQRNAEWCGHGPALEQDIAITNISLDLIGQARNLYQYAALLYNGLSEEEQEKVANLLPRIWKTYDRSLEEDDLAFLRDEHQYLNVLLAELPKGDWAQTILRQFFFSAFQFYQYTQLQQCASPQLVAIAQKSLKEVTYHLRWSSEWVVRLGDGTDESNQRINNALKVLWPFIGELFAPASYEITNASALQQAWLKKVTDVLETATLELPKAATLQKGGKKGVHTEYLGYLLTEMQYLQRTYPNATW